MGLEEFSSKGWSRSGLHYSLLRWISSIKQGFNDNNQSVASTWA